MEPLATICQIHSLDLYDRRTEIRNITVRLELMKKHLITGTRSDYTFPELADATSIMDINLHKTQSMIRELESYSYKLPF